MRKRIKPAKAERLGPPPAKAQQAPSQKARWVSFRTRKGETLTGTLIAVCGRWAEVRVSGKTYRLPKGAYIGVPAPKPKGKRPGTWSHSWEKMGICPSDFGRVMTIRENNGSVTYVHTGHRERLSSEETAARFAQAAAEAKKRGGATMHSPHPEFLKEHGKLRSF